MRDQKQCVPLRVHYNLTVWYTCSLDYIYFNYVLKCIAPALRPPYDHENSYALARF